MGYNRRMKKSKPAAHRKTGRINARISPALEAELARAADKLGVPVSTIVRIRLAKSPRL